MSFDYGNQLLREGIIRFKSKEYTSARLYFNRALTVSEHDDTRESANFYLSLLTDDPTQKREYLAVTLSFNPHHIEALKALAILDGKLKADEIVNADELPAQSTETQNAKADRFACPKCGSRMVFDGDGQSLICEFCDRNERTGQNPHEKEQDFIIAMATGLSQRAPVAMNTFKCQGCGAQFILPAEVISETCSYCDSVYVLVGVSDLVEPDSIIPMAFNQHQAAKHLVEWVARYEIKPQDQVQAPRGLYLPIWMFDVKGSLAWKKTEHVYDFRDLVPRHEPVNLRNVLVYATQKLSGLLDQMMESFSFGAAVPYDAHYLAGWPAEIYQKTLATASLEARQQAVQQTLPLICDADGDAYQPKNYDTANLSIAAFKLMLIPVWVTEYKFADRAYHVVINGQSGFTYGETASQGSVGWLENGFHDPILNNSHIR